jgi:hypothetical protein
MTEPPKIELVRSEPVEPLDDLDYWRLSDELTIQEAALLVAGVSPTRYSDVEVREITDRPRGYEAAKAAITNGLRAKTIVGVVEPQQRFEFDQGTVAMPGTISLSSRVAVESLKTFLTVRSFRPAFFFPEKQDHPDYLDPKNPRFAPKLAAAVRAWQAVVDPGGKHPKSALTKWLREHAAELGLTDDEGKLNETGIEEAAKVANWQPAGGAPKTPFGSEPTPD